MSQALLLVDLQRDYFPGGAHPLVEPDAAVAAAARLLEDFRDRGAPVIHLQHVWDAPEATFMRPGTEGVEIHPLVAPESGEPVIQKAQPNGFSGTSLERELRGHGIEEILVAGMMSSMCVDSTVRAAVDHGFTVTVVHDACAAPDLEFVGETIPGAMVHAAFMAALAGSFATVVSADEALRSS
jgi:nicotinamidase-related amidase